jgi:hypothetical protein
MSGNRQQYTASVRARKCWRKIRDADCVVCITGDTIGSSSVPEKSCRSFPRTMTPRGGRELFRRPPSSGCTPRWRDMADRGEAWRDQSRQLWRGELSVCSHAVTTFLEFLKNPEALATMKAKDMQVD